MRDCVIKMHDTPLKYGREVAMVTKRIQKIMVETLINAHDNEILQLSRVSRIKEWLNQIFRDINILCRCTATSTDLYRVHPSHTLLSQRMLFAFSTTQIWPCAQARTHTHATAHHRLLPLATANPWMQYFHYKYQHCFSNVKLACMQANVDFDVFWACINSVQFAVK